MAIQPTAAAGVNGQITVTGHATDSTLIFDATVGDGVSYFWEVYVENLDADAGDVLYIGYSIASSLPATGLHLGVATAGASDNRIKLRVPPHGKLYANCTAAETRDVRVLASPLV